MCFAENRRHAVDLSTDGKATMQWKRTGSMGRERYCSASQSLTSRRDMPILSLSTNSLKRFLRVRPAPCLNARSRVTPPNADSRHAIPQPPPDHFAPGKLIRAHEDLFFTALPAGHSAFPKSCALLNEPHRVVTNMTFINISDICQYVPFCLDFGPFNLGSTARFCYALSHHLSQDTGNNKFYRSNKKIVVFSDTSPESITNAITAVCTYVMLFHNKSAAEAFAPFSSLDRRHIVPFHDATFVKECFPLSVLDCLRGVDKAMRHGWVCKGLQGFDLQTYEYYDHPLNGDIHVVVPNKFIAFAGPTAQVEVHEGCYETFTASFYANAFLSMGVTDVVRLNRRDTNDYDASEFRRLGFRHHDLIFDDCTSPSDDIVARFLDISSKTSGVVAVHCKAGLGRTGTLIALDMMRNRGFTARESIGWLRFMRPGSVIHQQQDYLCEMEGCDSVLMRVQAAEAEDDGWDSQCGPPGAAAMGRELTSSPFASGGTPKSSNVKPSWDKQGAGASNNSTNANAASSYGSGRVNRQLFLDGDACKQPKQAPLSCDIPPPSSFALPVTPPISPKGGLSRTASSSSPAFKSASSTSPSSPTPSSTLSAMDTPNASHDPLFPCPGTPPPLTLAAVRLGGKSKAKAAWQMANLWMSLPNVRSALNDKEHRRAACGKDADRPRCTANNRDLIMCLSSSFEGPSTAEEPPFNSDSAGSAAGSAASGGRALLARSYDAATTAQVVLDNTLSMRRRAAHRIAASLSFDSMVDSTAEGHLVMHSPPSIPKSPGAAHPGHKATSPKFQLCDPPVLDEEECSTGARGGVLVFRSLSFDGVSE